MFHRCVRLPGLHTWILSHKYYCILLTYMHDHKLMIYLKNGYESTGESSFTL